MKKIQRGGLILGILVFGALSFWVTKTFAISLFTASKTQTLKTTTEPFVAEETYFAPPEIKSLDDICSYLGITIYKEDKLRVFPDPSLGIGSKIEIKRAPILYIDDGGTKWIGRTWKETIVEYFKEKGIDLGPNDKVSPDPQTMIKSGIKVNVTRVAKTTEKVEETIYYKTSYINDNDLEKGKSRLVRAGENGLRETIYEYTTENGVKVDKRILEEHTVKSPVDRIVARGTRVVLEYLGTGYATWYSQISGNTCAFRGYYGKYLRVTRISTGKSIIVKVVDWGPHPSSGNYIDLSADAFKQLAPLGTGKFSAKVELVK